MSFREKLSQMWGNIQYILFPELEIRTGNLTALHKKLVSILELIRIEEFIPCTRFNQGRRACDRMQIARSYIAKIVFKFSETKQLIDRLIHDKQLRIICGWDVNDKIPSESKFSRVFKKYAELSLPEIVHQSLIKEVYKNELVLHLVNDSTPIKAREKETKKTSSKELKKKRDKDRRIRKKTGELNRREKQINEDNMDTLIKSLPKTCDKGMKKSAQGYTTIWKGYKLHARVDDNCIPLAAIITSASLNDSEVAIPLIKKTNLLTTNLYDLMDAAYDHPEIHKYSVSSGHVPIIDKCPRNAEEKKQKTAERKGKKLFKTAEDMRYKERFPKERFNALYKDYHSGRTIYYRGHQKISCHVMFGVLTLTASLLLKVAS